MDSEGTNLDIIVSPNQSQDDSRGPPIEMKNPEYPDSLKREVYLYALRDMWKQAKSIFDEHPDMVRIPLTDSTGDTALHAAVSANSGTFVKGLVNLLTPPDLEIKNSKGNTAFCTAAVSGNGAFLLIMIVKNRNLPLISGYGEESEMLPVHLAASNGHHKIVKHLSADSLLERMDEDDIRRLFFMTIEKGMFDVATKLFEKYPAPLAVARRNDPNDFGSYISYHISYPTALHVLARKRPQELYMKEDKNIEGAGLQLLKKLWSRVTKLESTEILELISEPSPVLFDAIESGNVEAVKWILYMNPELITFKNPWNGLNLLQYSVQYRRSSLLFFMLKMRTVNHMTREVNEDGDNILHLAAIPTQDEESSRLRPNIQMRNELTWFQEVVRNVPPELMRMRNKEGKTPYDVFYNEHEVLSKEIKVTAKGISESGMVVATLVAAVAFASALTVPGDKTSAWFIVFILANAAALFTSCASILSFLSNITTSRFTESKFVISLHTMSLITGPALLFVSVVAMVVSFTAASFLIFDHTSKWVAYVVTVMAFFPILLVLWFQDWGDLIQSIFHSKD